MAAVALAVLVCARPSPLTFLLGLTAAVAGETIRFWAIGFSRGHTRGLEVEAPFLATGGPYSRSRHPLYLGNALNSLGVTIAAIGRCTPTMAGALMLFSATAFALVYGTIIPLEEEYLALVHGEQYQSYKISVPRLIPNLKGWVQGGGQFCLDSALYFERWTLFWWLLIWSWLGFLAFRMGGR